MTPNVQVSDLADDVYRLACLELRGGNRGAVYPAELPGLNAWISCRPLHPATRGGDLYYLSVCSQGSISRITIADVAGHGEDVSTLAECLRNGLRNLKETFIEPPDQGRLVPMVGVLAQPAPDAV